MAVDDNKLPNRDIWLLPLIAAATLVIMLLAAEATARVMFVEQPDNQCKRPDPVIGYKMAANCQSNMKAAEGSWYTVRYNDCGFRSPDSCLPLSADSRRIAFVGSSLTAGLLVPWQNSVAGRLARDLTDKCHSHVEAQNLGGIAYRGKALVERMHEALMLNPQLVISLIMPFDVESLSLSDAPDSDSANDNTTSDDNGADLGVIKRIQAVINHSRTIVVLEHYLFRNTALYVRLYLRYGDKADFLRQPLSPQWQARLKVLDKTIAAMAQQSHAAHVPFLIAFVPQEAQLYILASHRTRKGIDPHLLATSIKAIADRHGVKFADMSDILAEQADPVDLYFQVDAHPSEAAQSIVADQLVQYVATMPAFTGCNGGNQ
jgi:hypothetical protein